MNLNSLAYINFLLFYELFLNFCGYACHTKARTQGPRVLKIAKTLYINKNHQPIIVTKSIYAVDTVFNDTSRLNAF